MTKEQINEIAKRAIAWAEGSWGQSEHDKPKYDHDTMVRIYHQISEIAAGKATMHDNQI